MFVCMQHCRGMVALMCVYALEEDKEGESEQC